MIETIIAIAITIILGVYLVWRFIYSNEYPDGIEPIDDYGNPDPVEDKSDYWIEEYPETGLFFPYYKDRILDHDDLKGLITTRITIYGVFEPCESKEEAERIIALHKEQKTKIGVIRHLIS